MEFSTKINNFVENYLSTIEVDRMIDYSEKSKFGYLTVQPTMLLLRVSYIPGKTLNYWQ